MRAQGFDYVDKSHQYLGDPRASRFLVRNHIKELDLYTTKDGERARGLSRAQRLSKQSTRASYQPTARTNLIISHRGSTVFWEGERAPREMHSVRVSLRLVQSRELECATQWRFWRAVVGGDHIAQVLAHVGPRQALAELVFNADTNLLIQ